MGCVALCWTGRDWLPPMLLHKATQRHPIGSHGRTLPKKNLAAFNHAIRVGLLDGYPHPYRLEA